MVFISVDRGRAGLLLAGFITLFAGKVSVGIVVAQPGPVLVTLATYWEERKYEGGEERMETSEQPATMTASFKIALPSPLAVAPQTPYSCLKCYRWVSVKGDRCQPCSPTAPDKRSSNHAASSPSYWPRQMHIQSPQLIPP